MIITQCIEPEGISISASKKTKCVRPTFQWADLMLATIPATMDSLLATQIPRGKLWTKTIRTNWRLPTGTTPDLGAKISEPSSLKVLLRKRIQWILLRINFKGIKSIWIRSVLTISLARTLLTLKQLLAANSRIILAQETLFSKPEMWKTIKSKAISISEKKVAPWWLRRGVTSPKSLLPRIEEIQVQQPKIISRIIHIYIS